MPNQALGGVEVIELDPFVATYDAIVSPEECAHLRGLAERSKTGVGQTTTAYDHDRTTLRIAKRLAHIVGLPVEHTEGIRICRYGRGERDGPHYDSPKNDGRKETMRFIEKGGARLKTAIVFLNTTSGGVRLPRLSTTISSQEGRVVAVDNTKEDRSGARVRHPHAEIATTPPTAGDSYIATLWFRQGDPNKRFSSTHPAEYGRFAAKQSESSAAAEGRGEVGTTPPQQPQKRAAPRRLAPAARHTPHAAPRPAPAPLAVAPVSPLRLDESLPFMNINGIRVNKDLGTYVTPKDFIVVTHRHLDAIHAIQPGLTAIKTTHNVIAYGQTGPSDPSGLDRGVLYTTDAHFGAWFKCSDSLTFHVLTPNRQLKSIMGFDEFRNRMMARSRLYDESGLAPPPHVAAHKTVDNELLVKSRHFMEIQRYHGRIRPDATGTHLCADEVLSDVLDRRLRRTTLPEILKIFGHGSTYRTSYDLHIIPSASHPMRPERHRDRRCAVYTVIDTQGTNAAKVLLPEYHAHINVPKGTTVAIPAACARLLEPPDSGMIVCAVAHISEHPAPGLMDMLDESPERPALDTSGR